MKEVNAPQLDIEISEDIAMGKFSNLAVINHSQGEFILDFLSLMPGMPKAKVVSRVIVSPIHAKKIVMAMEENIKRYESVFGMIKDLEHEHYMHNTNTTPLA